MARSKFEENRYDMVISGPSSPDRTILENSIVVMELDALTVPIKVKLDKAMPYRLHSIDKAQHLPDLRSLPQMIFAIRPDRTL